jgi:hypothetical protein
MPTLIYEKTGQPVNVGDVIHSNGRAVIVCGWTEPRHPASTGRIQVQTIDERKSWSEYFPHVFDCDWTGEPTANPWALGPFLGASPNEQRTIS